MSDIILYDPSGIVINMVTNYVRSANTPDYENLPNVLINPDVSALGNISRNYWKVDSSENVIEMTTNEKTVIDNFLNAKILRNKNFKVSTYDATNSLIKDTWYEKDNGDGTYSNIAQESVYTYNNGNVISRVDTIYYFDGTIQSATTWNYFVNDKNQIIEKKVG